MTAPTTAGVTNPYTLTPGAAPVRITDGANNSPAGLTLVNRGDNGGTVWVMGGPAAQGAAIPLGPGASLQWSDPVNLPYAYLTGTGTLTETLVVSSQSAGYANPSVVAAALIQQGIPSTMVDTGYGTYRLSVGNSTAGITVGSSASLIVSAAWPQPTPQGANAVRLKFDDPAVPDLPPIYYYLTNNNAVEAGQNKWQVPVVGPRLTVTNLTTPDNNNADAYVQIAGTNRPSNGFRQIGAAIGTKSVSGPSTAVGLSPVLNATNVDGAGSGTATSGPMTRANGPVTLQVFVANTTGGGVIFPGWVDETATAFAALRFPIPASGNDFTFQWNHPSVPVYWRYYAFSAIAGNWARVTVLGGT